MCLMHRNVPGSLPIRMHAGCHVTLPAWCAATPAPTTTAATPAPTTAAPTTPPGATLLSAADSFAGDVVLAFSLSQADQRSPDIGKGLPPLACTW